MKLFEIGSDRKAEIHFLCDDAVTSFYNDPDITDENTWIVPVQTNKSIGVTVHFRGTFLAIHVDLVVDGMLRHCESSTKQSPGRDTRHYEFTTGFLCNNTGLPNEGILWATAKDYNGFDMAIDGTLGSVEIIISVSTATDEPQYPFPIANSFGPMPVGQNYDGLVPKHEICLASLNHPQPSPSAVTRLRKRALTSRPGAQVWTRVKLLYRAEGMYSPGSVNTTQVRERITYEP
jgi:hypothetical protein